LRLSTQGAHFESVKYPVGAFRRHADQITSRPLEFGDEYAKLFARYGISIKTRRWGRWLHRFSKLRSGAYGRQLRARAVRGRDLRWFRAEEGTTAFLTLLGAGYGIRNFEAFFARVNVASRKCKTQGDGI
jgi:hypothetical protein